MFDVVKMGLVAMSHTVKFSMGINDDSRGTEGAGTLALLMILLLEFKRIDLFSLALSAFVFAITR